MTSDERKLEHFIQSLRNDGAGLPAEGESLAQHHLAELRASRKKWQVTMEPRRRTAKVIVPAFPPLRPRDVSWLERAWSGLRKLLGR